MKNTFRLWIGIFCLTLGLMSAQPALAGCSAQGCPHGNCVNCSYTTYYDCSTPYHKKQCSDTHPDTCCKLTGSCTVCDNTGACIIGGCGTGGGGGGGVTGGGGGSGPVCGDGACNGTETCATCPADCGACPTTTAKARAVLVPESTKTCDVVNASTDYVDTTFTINLYSPTTSHGATYAEWTGLTPGGQSVATYESASLTYIALPLACYTLTPPGTTGNAFAVTTSGGDTVAWNVAFSADALPWVRAEGGDVYAATDIKSYLPPLLANPFFNDVGAGGYPGIVTYGSTYDFNGDSLSTGEGNVSTTGWLANESYTAADYYQVMYHRFDSPAPTATGDQTLTNVLAGSTTKGSADVYYYTDNVTIGANPWIIPGGQSVVVFVGKNLTINEPITIAPGGFLTFIVNGDISVDTSVGTTSTSATSVLDGIYIADGTFHTGLSTTAAARRLVGTGTFVAGNFDLQRDLDADTENNNYSAELFVYNPQLLLTMPDAMKDLPVTWQEVAP